MSVYLVLLTVVALGNEVTCIFRSLRTLGCGRHVAGDTQKASESWRLFGVLETRVNLFGGL